MGTFFKFLYWFQGIFHLYSVVQYLDCKPWLVIMKTSVLAWWLTWLAGDWLQWQAHLGVRGDCEGLGAWVESRDHHVGHVHLLGQGMTNTPYINVIFIYFINVKLRFLNCSVRCIIPCQCCCCCWLWYDVMCGDLWRSWEEADLDLLLEQVDLVLLLDQLLLLFGDLRRKTSSFSTQVCTRSVGDHDPSCIQQLSLEQLPNSIHCGVCRFLSCVEIALLYKTFYLLIHRFSHTEKKNIKHTEDFL